MASIAVAIFWKDESTSAKCAARYRLDGAGEEPRALSAESYSCAEADQQSCTLACHESCRCRHDASHEDQTWNIALAAWNSLKCEDVHMLEVTSKHCLVGLGSASLFFSLGESASLHVVLH